ncbi:MAG: hypothetical protein WCK90_03595 [archaeon]
MTNEYKPARKEVVAKMMENYTGIAKRVGFGLRTGFVTAFALPSAVAKANRERYHLWKLDREGKLEHYNNGAKMEDFVKMVGFCSAGLASFVLTVSAGASYVPFILTPVITNIVAGAYEFGRKVYRETEKKIIQEEQKQNNNDLIAKLEARK